MSMGGKIRRTGASYVRIKKENHRGRDKGLQGDEEFKFRERQSEKNRIESNVVA